MHFFPDMRKVEKKVPDTFFSPFSYIGIAAKKAKAVAERWQQKLNLNRKEKENE